MARRKICIDVNKFSKEKVERIGMQSKSNIYNYIQTKNFYQHVQYLIISEAEEYRAEEEEVALTIQARNELKCYAYNLRNTLQVRFV